MAVYTTIDDPSAYFQTVLYTGNATARAITFDGNTDMQPDWVWGKIRTQTYSHRSFDSVRGAGKGLHNDTNEAEFTQNANVSAFNSNGFSLGDDNGMNSNGDTHVAWCWKAGTSFTNDASSTGIGTIDSTGSVSDTAGFSIVSYTGTGSAGTIKHGLSTVPKVIICKARGAEEAWPVYHVKNTAAPETDHLYLNTNDATGDSASHWNDTAPTSTVFSVKTSGESNKSSTNMIAYCFAEKQGYSKFGSYTGNGNADGTFIFTGFKPAWLMFKSFDTSSRQWEIHDNKRDTFNPSSKRLFANLNNAEATENYVDFLANGFKFRTTDVTGNESGTKYIFLAFAESPFVNSNSIPGTAR